MGPTTTCLPLPPSPAPPSPPSSGRGGGGPKETPPLWQKPERMLGWVQGLGVSEGGLGLVG